LYNKQHYLFIVLELVGLRTFVAIGMEHIDKEDGVLEVLWLSASAVTFQCARKVIDYELWCHWKVFEEVRKELIASYLSSIKVVINHALE
jgi:hypothetical protein